MLVFHGVSEPKIAIDWGEASLVHELSIATIDREPASGANVDPSNPNYRWNIRLNWPESGVISFAADGFTQTLSAEPVVIDEQSFTLHERNKLLARLSS